MELHFVLADVSLRTCFGNLTMTLEWLSEKSIFLWRRNRFISIWPTQPNWSESKVDKFDTWGTHNEITSRFSSSLERDWFFVNVEYDRLLLHKLTFLDGLSNIGGREVFLESISDKLFWALKTFGVEYFCLHSIPMRFITLNKCYILEAHDTSRNTLFCSHFMIHVLRSFFPAIIYMRSEPKPNKNLPDS